MSREWKRVYDREKLPTCIAIVGIGVSTSTLLYVYDKIITEWYMYIGVLVVLAIFTYFYLTKKKRRNPTPPNGCGGSKTLEELVENH